MTEKNDKNNTSKSSNDISEMLRLLRESVESDRRAQSEGTKNAEIAAADDEIKASLERVFEEVSLDKPSVDDEDDDIFVDDEEESSWFELEEEDELEEMTEEDTEDEDPWYSDDEPEEEPVEEDEPEESTEDEPAEPEEEDPDSEDPWYSDEEPAEDPVEEEPEETTGDEPDEPEEEDPDSEDLWYSDEEPAEETVEDEPEEITEDESEESEEEVLDETAEDELAEQIENAQADETGWYALETSPADSEEENSETASEDISLDDESIWYNGETDDKEETTENEELYQDEDFDDDDQYDEDFDDEADYEQNEVESSPENDYAEQDLYIYDAEKETADEYIYNDTESEAVDEESPAEDDENSIDETDIGFLNTLGIASDEEEESKTGASDEEDDYAGDISYDYDGGEYVLENQRHEIGAGYRNERKRTLTRLIICGSVALLLLVYEMLAGFGVHLPGLLNQAKFPLSHIMISLQCLVICALLSAKQLYVGAADLIRLKATPYSVSAAVVVANVLYSIAISIALPESFATFNFVGALSVVMAIAYEYLLLISEEHIFGVFSTKKGQKYAFVSEDGSDEASGDGELSLCAYSTEFNKNYFFRMRKRAEDYKYLTYVLLAALGLSVLVFVVSLICKTGFALATKNGIMTVNFALPLGVFGAFSYPVFRASVKALGNRGALVGASAIDEYSKTRFVTFGEEELFSSLKTTHLDLKPAGNDNVSDVLCKTSVLLSAIGGPMKRMVEMMQSDFAGSEVEINEIFDDGISARTEGVEMLAGSAQFLRQHGVEVDERTDFKDVDEDNEVLYVSIDGKLAARYYLKYKPDMEFIKLVNALGARGISVGIRTRNPGINSDIIARRCPELRYKVYTIKTPAKNENELELKRVTTDSGIVASGKALSLAYPLLACCDLKRYYKVDMFIRIISAVLGTAVVIANAITSGSSDLNVLTALLYQCFWLLPTALFGLFHFKHRSKKKKFKIVYR